MGSRNRLEAALFGALLLSCATSTPTGASAPTTEASGGTTESEAGPETVAAAQPEQPVATAEESGTGGTGSSPGSPEPSADDGLDSDIAALSASTQTHPAPAVASSSAVLAPDVAAPGATRDPGGREIVYRVTPKGLVIEIDGIHLRPEAKPFKEKSGAYGIELVVNAESFDGRQYWVNKPGEGPLSIAGKVEGKAGKGERFADQRSGSGEDVVMEGTPRRFAQRWPGRGQPKLWQGQTVTLEVGLWGIRAESERERPVRRLFVVKMVAGSKSPAVITPPTLDWGT
jgi:hypothetical protein